MSRQAELEALGLDVSRETIDALDLFAVRLRHWSSRINLVAPADADHVWHRHILDSAQLFRLGKKDGEIWCDIGSGGGLPGIVIAILAKDLTPDQTIALVESDGRKAAFLRVVAQELGLACQIHVRRVEDLQPVNADTLSARALAPLSRLLSYARRHLAAGGIALFPKGRNAPAEIDQARADWNFDLDIVPSMTEAGASILRLSAIARKTEGP